MIRRLGGALVREVKRELCVRGLGEFTFRVSRFGEYSFRCGNRVEYDRTVEYGSEAASLGALLLVLRPDDVLWDVGASVGLITVHSAGLVRHVVAFEPDPATFARLQENLALNGLCDRADCRMEALGDRVADVALQTDGLNGNAPAVADLGRHGGVACVKMTTIDSAIDMNVPTPTVLKIDVEGAELLTLRGGSGLLGSGRAPRILFVEVHKSFLPAFGATP